MKLNYKRTIFVGFAFFLICAFWQAYDTLVPMMLVNRFGLSQTVSGVIMALDNIIALFMLPLFGALSDKNKSKYGRRTPFVVLGTLLAVVLFMVLSVVDNVQLSRVQEGEESSKVYETFWEENASIPNAEYSSVNNKDVPKKMALQDYVSLIVNGKTFDEASADERVRAKDWYRRITQDYFAYAKGDTKDKQYETTYAYDLESNTYSLVKITDEGGTVKYIRLSDGAELRAIDTSNAYTNLISTARQAHAWEVTAESPATLVFFILLLLLLLISMATFRSPAVALMPDVTVKPLRSQGNAIINLMGTAGGMCVLGLGIVFATGKAYNQMMSYIGFIGAVVALMLVALAVFIWKVREPKWSAEMEQQTARLGLEEIVTDDSGERRKLSAGEKKSLALILASVALWFIGYNAVTSKYSLYASSVLHMDYNTTLLIAQAAAIVAYIPVGALAAKIGRKKSILSGILLLTAAFFGAIFLNANSPMWLLNIFFALAGIGWATINVNSFPMVVELAKGGNVGKYTGYYYTASMAAQVLTPYLSGQLMDSIGMRTLFPYATLFVAASFVTMLFVRHGDTIVEAKHSVLENFDIED